MSAGHAFKEQEQLSLATRDVGWCREVGQGQRTCWHQLGAAWAPPRRQQEAGERGGRTRLL